MIRGNNDGWRYSGCASKGKQAHLASAVEELAARHPEEMYTRASTLLIDDDADNIEAALQNCNVNLPFAQLPFNQSN